KVKVIHILSEERKPGFENGFVTADLIRKHAPEDYSLLICGPAGLYRHMELVVSELGLPARKVRREIIGVSGKPVSAEKEGPETYYDLTVIQGPETYRIKASSRETLLVAMERAGIAAPAKCRSGECGWCRSKVISGSYTASGQNDYRRHMDKETDHIHPCVTFPDSDIVLEVPRGEKIQAEV
ncbi:MAG: 2Fe-2S iron-sulfur cluster binding domain-containing protein, partial [Spirochaetales bacterium]|nr:2Fe-2S iron-sulfur cluster binding domain-containing protein [Spirochaetales bacterium]